uniref:Uncharacterized protein n=1 Tax=Arundo donax TaxID=35708 RepID=A0A0A9AI86_ARUDO
MEYHSVIWQHLFCHQSGFRQEQQTHFIVM